jgi:hypothetical protein
MALGHRILIARLHGPCRPAWPCTAWSTRAPFFFFLFFLSPSPARVETPLGRPISLTARPSSFSRPVFV